MSEPSHPKSIDDLLQDRLTETLRQDLCTLCPELATEHGAVLDADASESATRRRLKKAVAAIRSSIRRELKSDTPALKRIDESGLDRELQLRGLSERLKTQIDEIEDDAKFRRSKRYRQIKRVEAWASPWIDEFRQNPEFQDVMIGMHDSKQCPFLTGRVDDQATLTRLEAFVATKNPPDDLMIQVLTQPKRVESE